MPTTVSPHVYVENVRSFFGTTTAQATALCETAVSRGMLVRKRAYLCPSEDCQRVVEISEARLDPAIALTCEVCEARERPCQFPVREMKDMVCYALPDAAPASIMEDEASVYQVISSLAKQALRRDSGDDVSP